MKKCGKVSRLVLSGLFLLGMTGFSGAEAAEQYASKTLEVAPVKTEVKQISGVVYEQVPSRGYPNVPMAMDLLQPQKKEKMPAIVYVTGGGFINANRDNGVQLRNYLAEKKSFHPVSPGPCGPMAHRQRPDRHRGGQRRGVSLCLCRHHQRYQDL